MTIINEKQEKLCIEIHTTAPDEQRIIILKALTAAVRWNAGCPIDQKMGAIDEENLYAIACFIDSLIETRIIKENPDSKPS